MSAFDGAGKPYKGSSFRGALTVLIVSVVVIAGLWLAMILLTNQHQGALQNPPALTQQEENRD